MENNFIHIKLKDKSNNKSKEILKLFKLSLGNNVINLNYNRNKKNL